MRNFRWLIAAAVPVVAMGLAATSASAVVIDDFTSFELTGTTTGTVTVNDAQPANAGYEATFNTTSSYSESGLTTLSGDRTTNVTSAFNVNTSLNADAGTFSMETGNSENAIFELSYTGAGLNALQGNQSIEIEVEFVDLAGNPGGLPVQAFVDGVAALGPAQVITTPGTYTFNFAAAFGLVNSVEVTFDLAPGFASDLTISQISSPDQQIPEPASLLVWGAMGLTGMVAARRRRKLNQK